MTDDLQTPLKLDTDMIRLVQTCYLSWIIVHTKFQPYRERVPDFEKRDGQTHRLTKGFIIYRVSKHI